MRGGAGQLDLSRHNTAPGEEKRRYLGALQGAARPFSSSPVHVRAVALPVALARGYDNGD